MLKRFDFRQPIVRQVLFRRLVMMAVDSILIVASVLGAFALRLREQELFVNFLDDQIKIIPLALFCGLPVLYFSGWYRGLTRYAGSYSLYTLLPRSALMVLVLLLASTLFLPDQPPRSFWVLYWILFTGSAISSRILFRDLLLKGLGSWDIIKEPSARKAIRPGTLIYGAGSSGVALLIGLRNDPRFRIVGFLDDDPTLHGRTLQNLRICSPLSLEQCIQQEGVRKVLLAMPSMTRQRKRHLVDQLSHMGLQVLSIPSLSQLASGQGQVSDLKPVAIEDLLGREPSLPDPELLACSVKNKNVLVTGAGGSIGSELCRQIVTLNCNTIILFERNEYALYTIEKELLRIAKKSTSQKKVIPVLGDACNKLHLIKVCTNYSIDTVFHAAAYKHVPMVEANLCIGVKNNILSSKAIIQASQAAGVERVTLISTDKAVRPTNAMGASKRICELLFQFASQDICSENPIFSMVRFGNVLGSSGSVIPLFHRQISNGGPVTVTHPNITRYFMTIPEAVALVLQATGMARGGDLFLLDMGDPVRIAELARQMIELSGLRVRDENHPDGDIEISYTGLRPGEKLYEELLIHQVNEPTAHPLIRRAIEPVVLSHEDFLDLLNKLIDALDHWNNSAVTMLLNCLVPEYRPADVAPASRDQAIVCPHT